MPSDFTGYPKLLKGALVVFETKLPIPTNVVVFQYNPGRLERTFQRPAVSGDPRNSAGDTQNAVQPPVETFRLEVELDAADQLEDPGSNPLSVAVGLHPTLAALELLASPPSSTLILNKALTLLGSSMISPAATPLVLFVWGPARVVPVRVDQVSIAEEEFDQLLNPIRARVSLGLRALTLVELQNAGTAFEGLGIVNLVAKEVLARSNIFNSIQQIGASF